MINPTMMIPAILTPIAIPTFARVLNPRVVVFVTPVTPVTPVPLQVELEVGAALWMARWKELQSMGSVVLIVMRLTPVRKGNPALQRVSFRSGWCMIDRTL
jgi:hypothetical protein